MKLKERDAIVMNRMIQVCYRELKFKGTPEQECPWGHTEINDKCYKCKFYNSKVLSTLAVTEGDLVKLLEFLESQYPGKLNYDLSKANIENTPVLK